MGLANVAMSDLIFRLRRDHGNTRKLLRVAERQRVLFMAGDFLDEPIIDGLFAYLEYYPALYHHPLEDAVYRRLRERDEGAAGPFDDLEASHAELRDLLANLRIMAHQALFHAPISRQQFGDAADRFVEAYHRHIEEEEEFFFPSALEILR